MVPWAHARQFSPKRHLDRFSRFCMAHERDQQTDTKTDHATRYHLVIAAVQPNNNNNNNNNMVVFR